jgi:hypothetical protein
MENKNCGGNILGVQYISRSRAQCKQFMMTSFSLASAVHRLHLQVTQYHHKLLLSRSGNVDDRHIHVVYYVFMKKKALCHQGREVMKVGK